ncbi:hypothetical protein OEZ85_007334 [Tetradesmus obliquus]|uniref:Uncharacterized protein n=1 Tax=Tetradesmus obliquus TaxID=3088 RepID=A0ABY8U1G3_TETOB|nr:hypothetical protein OEZ85_007334 [Tetradesmus obliquus]
MDNMPAGADGFAKAYKPPPYDRAAAKPPASYTHTVCELISGKPAEVEDEADQDAAAPRPNAAATVFIDGKTNVTFSMADQLQSILGVITTAPLNGQGALTGAFLESIIGYWEFTLQSNYRFDDQAMQLMLPSIQQGQVAKPLLQQLEAFSGRGQGLLLLLVLVLLLLVLLLRQNASFVALASHLAQMQAQASIAETARARAAAEAAITERQRIGAASH